MYHLDKIPAWTIIWQKQPKFESALFYDDGHYYDELEYEYDAINGDSDDHIYTYTTSLPVGQWIFQTYLQSGTWKLKVLCSKTPNATDSAMTNSSLSTNTTS